MVWEMEKEGWRQCSLLGNKSHFVQFDLFLTSKEFVSVGLLVKKPLFLLWKGGKKRENIKAFLEQEIGMNTCDEIPNGHSVKLENPTV